MPFVPFPAAANVERVPGGYVVSRFFAVQAAAQRGMDLLMGVNEAAFDPVPAKVCSCPSGDGSLRWPCEAHPLNLPSDADGS